jgi:hypothetical protein
MKNLIKKAWGSEIENAKFYLRYTSTPQEDYDRGASCHFTPWNTKDATIEEVAEWLEIDEDEIEEKIAIVDDRYILPLNGLCCFALEAETLEDAIQEAQAFENKFDGLPKTLWIGEDADYDDCPDGDMFHPWAVGIELE